MLISPPNSKGPSICRGHDEKSHSGQGGACVCDEPYSKGNLAPTSVTFVCEYHERIESDATLGCRQNRWKTFMLRVKQYI